MVRMGLKLYPMHTAGRESAGHKIGWQGKLLPGWLEVPAGWVASWRLAGAPQLPTDGSGCRRANVTGWPG
jgi:hypothetical protein